MKLPPYLLAAMPTDRREEQPGSEVKILVDSGSGVTACPPWHAPEAEVTPATPASARSTFERQPLHIMPSTMSAVSGIVAKDENGRHAASDRCSETNTRQSPGKCACGRRP